MITDIKDYVTKSMTFRAKDLPTGYFKMGLVEEIGEVFGLLKREIREDGPLDKEALEKELGDVLWYAVNLDVNVNTRRYWLNELRYSPSFMGLPEDHKDTAIKTISSTLRESEFKTSHVPVSCEVSAISKTGKLLQNCAKHQRRDIMEVPETEGRLYSFDNPHLAPNQKPTIEWVAYMASRIGRTLLDIANTNLDKLEDRKERGVIKGKGDNR